MKKPMRLRNRITTYYLMVSITTLLLISILLYRTISQIELKEALRSTQTAVEKSGSYLELYIDRLKAVSTMMVENPELIAYFSDPDASSEAFIPSGEAMIHTAMSSDPFLKSIIMVSKDGRILSNEKSLSMSMSEDMMKEDWYVSAVHSGSMPVLTSARMQKFSMDKDNWVISISREITDTSGNNIGVLLLDIEYRVMEDYLANLDLGERGYAFILNDEEKAVYHQDTSYFENVKQMQELVELTKDIGYNVKENTLIYGYSLQNANWTLWGVASLDGLQAIKLRLLETFLVLGIVSVLAMAFLSYVFAKSVTKPILALEKAMSELHTGLQVVPVSKTGTFETKSLARHFNQMVERIDSLMAEIQDKEKSLRTYEINALHGQINPHFLYNTLDTIVWMAEFNDSEKVIEVTKALAQFFRLSLSGGSEMTTVENELEHIRKYLFIQKERYGEKLNYSIESDPNILNEIIPKIILQPFVENALYHGIRDLDHPGHIHVTAANEDRALVFTIEDDGKGFQLERVDTIKEKGIKLSGIGIQNVDQRLKLYYGDDYGVHVETEIKKGTRVTIRIPKEKHR